MTPKVIIGSAHHWQSPIQISAHQLARQFARHGWQVGFVANPLSFLHFIRYKDPIIASRIVNWRARGGFDENDHLFHYCPLTLMPLISQTSKHSFIVENWHKLSFPNPISVLKGQNLADVDLLILDSPLQSYLLDEIPTKRSVFRITDYNPGFSSATDTVTKMESSLIKRVDCVVITAERLRSYAEDMGAKRILHISNGVDVSHFTENEYSEPLEYQNIPKPRAIYVGSMAEWFDYALLKKAAKALPKVSFVLIGPDRMARKKLPTLPNIYILGTRSYDKIPSYLKHADVGLIPFDVVNYRSLVQAINPIKLYEYFACGLPVITTDWDELRDLQSPAILCKDADIFIQKLENLTFKEKRDDNLSLMRSFVTKADWKNRFLDFLKLAGSAETI